MEIQFDRFKTLHAYETNHYGWELDGTDLKVNEKNKDKCFSYFSSISTSFIHISNFKTLEECKIFCDLYIPNAKLYIESFDEWKKRFFHI